MGKRYLCRVTNVKFEKMHVSDCSPHSNMCTPGFCQQNSEFYETGSNLAIIFNMAEMLPFEFKIMEGDL